MKDDDDTMCYRSELEAAVKAEREACAELCEEDGLLWGKRYAAAIRSRGQDPMPLFDDWDKDWPK
jgi:hypothetical protein